MKTLSIRQLPFLKMKYAVLLCLVGVVFLIACQQKPVHSAATPLPVVLPAVTQQILATSTAAAVSTSRPLADFWVLPAQMFVVREGLAYVAAGEAGLYVFDMGDPEQPTAVADFDIEAWDIVADEDVLYIVGCQRQCVYTFDLSGEEPTLLEDVFQTNLFNQIVAMTIENELMILAVENGIFKVVDIGQRPWQIIQSVQMSGEIADLDSQYNFLYVTVPEQGVYLYDMTDPTAIVDQDFYPAPKPEWHEETTGVVYETAVDGEPVYLAAASRGLRILHHSVESEDRQVVDFQDDYFYHVRGETTAVSWQSPFFYVKSWDSQTGQYYLTVLRHLRHLAYKQQYIAINLIGEYALGKDDPGQLAVENGRVYFVNNGITEFHLPDGYRALTGTPPFSPTIIEPPTPEVQFVQQIGGSQFSLAVQDNIAYVGSGKTLHIYDVTNPTAPVEVNTLFFSEDINEIKVHNGHAYLRMEGFEWGYLLVLGLSDPVHPVEVAKVGYFVQDIELVDDRAYIIHGYYSADTTFSILDVANPTNIQEVGSFTTPFRDDAANDQGHSVAWANQYRMLDLAVSNDYAYIGWGDDWSCQDITCAGGLLVLDVSDATKPIESGVVFLGAELTSVTAFGETALGVDKFGQLFVFDVSDVENPHYISILEAALDGLLEEKMVVTGDELWVADGSNGVRRFDLTDLTHVTEKTGYQTDAVAQMLVAQNDHIYLVSGGAGLEILAQDDMDEPVTLTPVPSIPNATDIIVNGSIAYIADNERGLTVWDLTDPLNPIRVGDTIQGSQYPEELTLTADRLYARSVTLSESDDYFNRRYTVDVFDISQPLTPTYQLALPFEAQSFAIYNGRAYVTNDNQLSIWNLNDLESPELLGTYDAPGWLRGHAAVGDDVVYVSVKGGVLLVLDASDPANMQPVYSIDEVQGLRPVIFGAWDLKVVGDRLYTSCYWSGLCVYDISNPTQPVFVTTIPGISHDFEVIEDRVYILKETSQAAYELTLTAFNVSDLLQIRQLTDFPDDFNFSYTWPGGLAVTNDVVYVALGSSGLAIFEHKLDVTHE